MHDAIIYAIFLLKERGVLGERVGNSLINASGFYNRLMISYTVSGKIVSSNLEPTKVTRFAPGCLFFLAFTCFCQTTLAKGLVS